MFERELFFIRPSQDHMREIENRGKAKNGGLVEVGNGVVIHSLITKSDVGKYLLQRMDAILDTIASTMAEPPPLTVVGSRTHQDTVRKNADVFVKRRRVEKKAASLPPSKQRKHTLVAPVTDAQQRIADWYADWTRCGEAGLISAVPAQFQSWFTGKQVQETPPFTKFQQRAEYNVLMHYEHFLKRKRKREEGKK